jgi:hypothetical protein
MAVEDEQCNCTTNHQGRQYLSFRKNDLADVVVAHAPSQNKKNDGSADRVDPSFASRCVATAPCRVTTMSLCSFPFVSGTPCSLVPSDRWQGLVIISDLIYLVSLVRLG